MKKPTLVKNKCVHCYHQMSATSHNRYIAAYKDHLAYAHPKWTIQCMEEVDQ